MDVESQCLAVLGYAGPSGAINPLICSDQVCNFILFIKPFLGFSVIV